MGLTATQMDWLRIMAGAVFLAVLLAVGASVLWAESTGGRMNACVRSNPEAFCVEVVD